MRTSWFGIALRWWRRIGSAALLVLSVVASAGEEPNQPNRIADIRRQIQEEQIQPLFLSMTSVSSVDLDSLIAGLNQLTVPAQARKTPEGAGSSDSGPSETVTVPSVLDTSAKVIGQREPTDESDGKALEKDWLEQIRQIEQPIDPMGVADVLFQAGYLEQAERFYRMAAERVDSPAEVDWQWAVFQRANCLRFTQPQQARQLYEELLKKTPGSRWGPACKAAIDMLRYYEMIDSFSLKRFLSEPNRLSE